MDKIKKNLCCFALRCRFFEIYHLNNKNIKNKFWTKIFKYYEKYKWILQIYYSYNYKIIFKDVFYFNFLVNIYIKKNNNKIVHFLIEENNRTKKFKLQENSIFLATLNGNLDIIKLLISNGVLPQIGDNKAIRIASKFGFLHIVEYLLTFDNVEPDEDYNEALKLAIHYKHKDVELLLFKNEKVVKNLKKNDPKLYLKLQTKYISNKLLRF